MPTTNPRPYDEITLSTHEFWAQDTRQRDVAFAELRRDRPVTWQPPAWGSLMEDPEDQGYWAVVRHADVAAVSRANDVFSSAPENGGVMFENAPAQLLEETQSILTMDPPRHKVVRGLVSTAFTPRRIRLIEGQIKAQAAAVVDSFVAEGPRDFVEQVSSRLPLWTISEMIGVPQEDRERLVAGVDDMVGYNDPEYIGDGDPLMTLLTGIGTVHDIAQNLIEARRAHPEDDLMSELVTAEIEGERLTDEDLRSYFTLLAVAGNDTTRNTTSHGMLALLDHPEQRDLLVSDYDRYVPGAIDEFLRWGTPVMTFRRTAMKDVEIGGQQVAAGDKVVMFYSSADRDELVFEDPWTFDITRTPNHHVAFGGGGIHYCLGHHVARAQLRAIFSELLTKAPDLKLGEPEFVVGHFMNAIKRLPVL
ncbi:MAG: cytochrome P450 [Propionibacteriales bacterium]|nr:cytochrome P450 [Propionibacteriales bacterium]